MDLMDLDEVEREISQFRLADKTSPKDLKNDNFNDLNTIESFDNRLMIVVDTNVWITHLETLKKLINTLVLNNIFILVPKMVVREIDGIKKNLNSVGLLSKKVNDYFFESIQKEGTGIIFQMEHETFNEKKEWMEPDDLILDCILYQKKLKKNVILFSKDKNLCVKVKSNQVNFYNFDSERELCGIDLKNSQDDSRISTLMSIILQLFGDEPTSSFNGNSSGSQLNLNNSNNFNENLNMRIRNNISEKSNLKSRSNSNEKLNITKEKDGINFSRCSDGQYHSDPFFSIRLGISDVILNEEYGISFCLLSILPRIFGSGWEYSHEPRPWVPSYIMKLIMLYGNHLKNFLVNELFPTLEVKIPIIYELVVRLETLNKDELISLIDYLWLFRDFFRQDVVDGIFSNLSTGKQFLLNFASSNNATISPDIKDNFKYSSYNFKKSIEVEKFPVKKMFQLNLNMESENDLMEMEESNTYVNSTTHNKKFKQNKIIIQNLIAELHFILNFKLNKNNQKNNVKPNELKNSDIFKLLKINFKIFKFPLESRILNLDYLILNSDYFFNDETFFEGSAEFSEFLCILEPFLDLLDHLKNKGQVCIWLSNCITQNNFTKRKLLELNDNNVNISDINQALTTDEINFLNTRTLENIEDYHFAVYITQKIIFYTLKKKFPNEFFLQLDLNNPETLTKLFSFVNEDLTCFRNFNHSKTLLNFSILYSKAKKNNTSITFGEFEDFFSKLNLIWDVANEVELGFLVDKLKKFLERKKN